MLISFYALILLINYALAYLGTFSIGDGGNLNQWVASATNGGFEKLSLQAIFGFNLKINFPNLVTDSHR